MSFAIVTKDVDLNQALFQVTHGLYVITARDADRKNGQCLDALMQVTSAPPRIALGIGKRSLTHEMVIKAGKFVVNILDRDDPDCPEVIRHFGFQSGRDINKFADFPHEPGEGGIPILPRAKAFYECHVLPEFTVDLATHTLFVASVDRAGVREEGEPLTYNEYRKTMRNRR